MSDFYTALEDFKNRLSVPEIASEVDSNRQEINRAQSLFFLDIESTGMDLENDRIIQLAFLKKVGTKIDVYNDLCYTDRPMNFAAMGVHHITPEMVEDKCWVSETKSYLAFEAENVETNYFISHSNTLDVAMLENEGLTLKMKCIDTDQCARHLLKDAENYKLQTLRYQYGLYKKEKETAASFGIEEIRAHDALGDALLHYLLFEHLLTLVEGNVETLFELSHTPVLLEKITFGKYKEQDFTFEMLWSMHPEDFVWMYTHTALRWKDLENTVEYWLQNDPILWGKAQEKRKKMAWFD